MGVRKKISTYKNFNFYGRNVSYNEEYGLLGMTWFYKHPNDGLCNRSN